MKKLPLFLILLFSTQGFADTSKSEAEKWYQEFRSAKDKVFDGLFITKTNEHMKLTMQLNELEKRAEKLFGQPLTSQLATCTVVAIDLDTVWDEIHTLARTGQLEPSKPSFIASMAWAGGEKYPTCLAEIDKLK